MQAQVMSTTNNPAPIATFECGHPRTSENSYFRKDTDGVRCAICQQRANHDSYLCRRGRKSIRDGREPISKSELEKQVADALDIYQTVDRKADKWRKIADKTCEQWKKLRDQLENWDAEHPDTEDIVMFDKRAKRKYVKKPKAKRVLTEEELQAQAEAQAAAYLASLSPEQRAALDDELPETLDSAAESKTDEEDYRPAVEKL